MPNDLVLYNSKDGKSLMTVIYNGRECWIGKQVVELAGVGDGKSTLSHFINDGDLEDGVDYEILKGTSLEYFKTLINTKGCTAVEESSTGVNDRVTNLTIFYESGLWAFLSSLRTEEGKALRKWINREVLPSIVFSPRKYDS